ncbi:MAG: HEPN domain-containing protein [Leptospiraceae bacterium]|nr:HEPN domain-containing protein [Leptospiraceae bacterium]
MSIPKIKEEALRWLATAKEELDAAEHLFTGGFFAKTCFHCQQSAEMAIKSIWILEELDPWGHSIVKLLNELRQTKESLPEELFEAASILDKFYIRYPDGLPELTPGQSYRKSEAITALTAAKTIFQFAESYLN